MTEEQETYELTTKQIRYLRTNSFNNGYYSRGASDQRLTAFQGKRDYYKTLGYLVDPQFEDYEKWYHRGGLAQRIVDLPGQDTWKKPPQISEEGKTETPFVQAWDGLNKRLKVIPSMGVADRLSGIGRYGVLVIGFADIKITTDGEKTRSTKDPVDKNAINNPNDVLYLRPLSEGSVEITTEDRRPDSPRFGLPETYTVKIGDTQQEYHWTRILHLAENVTDTPAIGTPRMENAFNDLFDLLKLSGGGAEGAWLNMRTGVVVKPQEGFKMESDANMDQSIAESFAKFDHDLLRMWSMPFAGLDVEELTAGNVPDVAAQEGMKIDMIAADSGIPKRVLMGSAAGELASAKEDTRQWAGLIEARQKNYAEPDILRAFIDRLIGFGALPEPTDGYDVGEKDKDGKWKWPAIVTLTEGEEAEVRLKNAQARNTLRNELNALPTTLPEDRDLLGVPTRADVVGARALVDNASALVVRDNQRKGVITDAVYRAYLQSEIEALDV